ncbi:hypothetical protein [Leifsonia sp. Leaf264]|uniref:hypothetical protein n=1 Tax=Leifsonia sp. Leaf264 TaxID=1736314 RepID=UPI0006F1EA9F|nr:hypothetical protein [Leifsonia sp. Leaf264]KQO98468.1 hypothetical protein ASF30_10425 [Leifsonia sp. Leaf264]
MAAFSSSKHDIVNADPYPLVDGDGHRHSRPDGGTAVPESGPNAGHWVEIGGPSMKVSPRPEFFRPLTNPANPILEAFRGNVANPHPEDTVNGTFEEIVDLWVFYIAEGNQEVSLDPDHIDHARRVIHRLARAFPVDPSL